MEAATLEREERLHERDVAEDRGLVLDEHRVHVVADVLQLVPEVRGVGVAHADEGDAVPALVQALRHGHRVVVDAAALIAR